MTPDSPAEGRYGVLRFGVIGYGYWGPNLVRNLAENTETEVIAIADRVPERLSLVLRRYPGVQASTDYRELLRNSSIDAIAIATGVSTHFELALAALQAGKHVLVEKPLAATSEEARRLVEESCRRDRVLLVDHTFVYTGAVRKIRELIAEGALGDIYYYDSLRVNLGLFQHDVNVLWDLAVHDLSIMNHVLPAKPLAVSATGISHIPGSPENTAYLTLFFDGSLIAHINVNWLAPVKVRRALIGGSERMIVYDELDPSEKVKVYDKGIVLSESREHVYRVLQGYRTGDMWAPQLDLTEALSVEIAHFAACVHDGEKPLTDGHVGLQVVEVLEAATKSMQNQGRPVELSAMRPAVR
jgi:predicted dehydrogenase